MERERFAELFVRGLTRASLTEYLPCEEAFYRLTLHLLEVNAHTNLTAITEPHEIICKHYADSLSAAAYLPQGARVIDVGCGGGFPSLPLAIARPDLTIVALDSTFKKLQFVESAARELGLDHLTTLHARAEEKAQEVQWRETFDVAMARAVARLPVLAELCLPFVRPGGRFVSLKGRAASDELQEASRAIPLLGGSPPTLYAVDLGEAEEAGAHNIIVVSKEKKTPSLYPRVYAQINKKPL